jgi:hypothetical protein
MGMIVETLRRARRAVDGEMVGKLVLWAPRGIQYRISVGDVVQAEWKEMGMVHKERYKIAGALIKARTSCEK